MDGEGRQAERKGRREGLGKKGKGEEGRKERWKAGREAGKQSGWRENSGTETYFRSQSCSSHYSMKHFDVWFEGLAG